MDVMAMLHWKATMDEEYAALVHRHTVVLVSRHRGISVVLCKSVFIFKKNLDGTIHQYMAHPVARDFSHQYGVYY